MSLTCIVFTGFPLLQTLYLVNIQEKELSESFVLPIFCVLPFEVNSWLRYAVAFVLSYGAFIILSRQKTTETSVLLTICFYTIAVTRDICHKAKEFNIAE